MIATGRWRPLHGLVLALFFVSGLLGLLVGEAPGSVLTEIFTETQRIIWHVAVLIGSATAMFGEARQLKVPIVLATPADIARFVTGMLIERAGEILLSLNLVAYFVGVVIYQIPVARSLIVIVVALGLFGRIGQITMDVRRIRQGMVQAADRASTDTGPLPITPSELPDDPFSHDRKGDS